MRLWKKKHRHTEEEQQRIWALASYNWERSRGYMHTEEWKKHMAEEQRWYDEEIYPKL